MTPYHMKVMKAKSYIIGKNSPFRELYGNRQIYLMALPGMVLLFLFNYLPMFGLIIAFKDYTFSQGILGSDWQSPILYNFTYLFSSPEVFRATRNTLLLNALFISVETLCAVILAIALSEMTCRRLRKGFQSMTFLPFFMSWIIVSVFVYGLFGNDTGLVNMILTSLGRERIAWYRHAQYWPWIMLLVFVWKSIGYSSIIYLATITGIDPSYYEAAKIDGASRWQSIRFISIPMLIPTLTILTLLKVGRIMNADFGMFYGIIGDNSLLFATTDVLDTFIYRNLRKLGDIGMSSAAGLYQSIIGFCTVLFCNHVARRYREEGSLF